MKKYVLFDRDGVLVDTGRWYCKAGERALAGVGLVLDPGQYLRDMSQGAGTWAQARAAGADDHTVGTRREVRNACYQEYLRTGTRTRPGKCFAAAATGRVKPHGRALV